MKLILTIIMYLAVTSTSSIAGFRTGDGSNSSGGNGFSIKAGNSNFYDDPVNDPTIKGVSNKVIKPASKTLNVNKKPDVSIQKKPETTIKEAPKVRKKIDTPLQTPIVTTTKKVQKVVSRGGVVSYSWASSQQIQTDLDDKTEIIAVSNNRRITTPSASVLGKQKCKVDNVGVNIGNLVYYGSEMPLKDLAKMAAPWDADSELDVDTDGYIKSLSTDVARTIITDDNWGRDVADNRYVVLYDGEGRLDFNLIKPKVIKSEPGRIEIELQHGRAGMLQTSTNPANYLRNIRIIPLEHEQDYDKVITRKKFRDIWSGVGVIRYLNSQRTNNSTETEWSDRQKRTTFGAKKGQSLEDIIQMSNEMNSSPWLLVPHLADDDYFRQMALYVKANLDPNLKVYIEYTNEAWNFGFKQANYLYQLSQKNGTSRQYEYGIRAKKLFDVWDEVFGGNDRLVRVIGTQLYYPWISEQILKTPGLVESVDALAVGYYIGHEFSEDKMIEKVVNMTDDEVFDYLYRESFPGARKVLTEQKRIAEQNGIDLIAYEAGQHLLASHKWRENSEVVDRFIALNRSPKMYQLYMDMYKQWNDIGGDLIVWFQTAYKPSKWGNWGLLENVSQNPSSAPKFRAFKEMLLMNGCI